MSVAPVPPDGQPTFTFGTDAYTAWLDSPGTKLCPWVGDTITNPHTSGGSGVEDPD